MSKKLQFVIGISCLVITGLFVYYFASYLPQKDMVALRKECMTLGEKKVNQYKEESKEFRNGEISSSDYVFDAENKRCLYRDFLGGTNLTEKDVYDLFTNQKLAGYVEVNERITEGNIGAYRLLEIDYFEGK
jgi:hypothetical protein